MRALVTGANGFVGSHLVRHLLEQGDEVRALVRKTSDLTRLEGLDAERVYGDLGDGEALRAAVDGVQVVYHVAGTLSGRTQDDFDRVNVRGTETLVGACLEARERPHRVVGVSSIAASGPALEGRPRTEDDPPAPVSRYGRSKLGGERALAGLDGEIEAVVARPPVVYGSGDTETLALYRAVQRGVAIRLGHGQRVSMVHVHDLARGLRLAGTVPGVDGQAFFLKGPQDGTLHDLQLAIARRLDRRVRTVPVPMAAVWLAGWGAERLADWTGRSRAFGMDKVREARQTSWEVSGEKARERLGYVGALDLDAGVAEAVEGYRRMGWLR